MGRIRKLAILLALCLVLCALPVTSVNAVENGSLWLRHNTVTDQVTVNVCADTAVASGVITITYDADILEFVELVVSDAFVLAHAVNDKEAGIIQISWIGTDTKPDTDGYQLMRLKFVGDPDQRAVLSGTVYDASGNTLAITELNLNALQAAIAQAEALNAEDYTAESFANVSAALESIETIMGTDVTPAQLDALTQALVAAMDNLVVYVPEPEPTDPPATEPAPTEPKPTEPTQLGSTPAQTEATQPSTQAPIIAPKRDNSWMLIALAALGVVAVAAAVVILKKRGKK